VEGSGLGARFNYKVVEEVLGKRIIEEKNKERIKGYYHILDNSICLLLGDLEVIRSQSQGTYIYFEQLELEIPKENS